MTDDNSPLGEEERLFSAEAKQAAADALRLNEEMRVAFSEGRMSDGVRLGGEAVATAARGARCVESRRRSEGGDALMTRAENETVLRSSSVVSSRNSRPPQAHAIGLASDSAAHAVHVHDGVTGAEGSAEGEVGMTDEERFEQRFSSGDRVRDVNTLATGTVASTSGGLVRVAWDTGHTQNIGCYWLQPVQQAVAPETNEVRGVFAPTSPVESLHLDSNTRCPRCAGPAYLGLDRISCLRDGGCRTAEERIGPEPRVFIDVADAYAHRPYGGVEVVHCIGPTSSFHAHYTAHDFEHPTREGVLALWRAAALAKVAGR